MATAIDIFSLLLLALVAVGPLVSPGIGLAQTPGIQIVSALVPSVWSAVNYDPNFTTPQPTGSLCTPVNGTLKCAGPPSSNFLYWAPQGLNRCGGGSSANITANGLHSHLNNTESANFLTCLGFAGAHEGHFSWMRTGSGGSFCKDQLYIVDFNCPTDAYGLRTPAQTDFPITFSWNASFLPDRKNPAHNVGEYHAEGGFYFWFTKGPMGPLHYSYLEAQVRLSNAVWNASSCQCWNDRPSGTQTKWNSGNDYGYSVTVDKLDPGQSSSGSYNLTKLYQQGMAAWGMPTNTSAILAGVEPGVEGFGSSFDVNFTRFLVETYEPLIVRADTNFNQVIGTADLALVQSLQGQCPTTNFGTYEWIADTNSSNPCIDGSDLALIQSFFPLSYDSSGRVTAIVAAQTSMNCIGKVG